LDDVEVGLPSEDLRGIAVDPFGGTLHVLEKGGGAIKHFDPKHVQYSKTSSVSSEDVAFMKNPLRIRTDATRLLYVIDREGKSLARYDAAENGDFVSRLGDGVELSSALRLAASPGGNVVVLDKDNYAAWRFDQHGWATARMGGEGSQPGQLRTPIGVGVDSEGNIYVADAKKVEVAKYQPKGGSYLRSFGGEGKFEKIRYLQMSSEREQPLVLQFPDELRIDAVNPQTADVVTFRPGGIEWDGPQLATYSGRLTGAPKSEEGYFWIVDDSGERVHVAPFSNPQGAKTVSDKFGEVTGITANAAGVVFVCDQEKKTIWLFRGDGTQGNTLQDEKLEKPTDVATDDLGHLYVFDKAGDGKILEFSE
jgi:hypothetical protein